MAYTHAIATWSGFYHNQDTGQTEGTYIVEAEGDQGESASVPINLPLPTNQEDFDAAVGGAAREALEGQGVEIPPGQVLVRAIHLA